MRGEPRVFGGRNVLPIQGICHQTIFQRFSKRKKLRSALPPPKKKMEPEATTVLGAAGSVQTAPLASHRPAQEGFCLPSTSNGLRLLLCHPIRSRAPAPGPLPARGTICPPCFGYLISPPSSTKPQQNHNIEKQGLASVPFLF